MKLSNEAKIGIMVFLVLVALGVLTYRTGDFQFRKEGYELKVHFYNIDGVDLNAPVRLNGMEVGVVKDIKILYGDDSKMELTLMIDEGTKIHQGAKAHVKNMGLFGEKYIGLTLGESAKGYLAPGSSITGQESANWEKMMADAEVIAENLKEISEKINERLKVNSDSIDEIVENLRVTSQKVVSISGNVDERLEVNKQNIDDMMANLKATSKNLEELSYDLKLNPWKLMYRKKDSKDKEIKKSKKSKK